MLEMPELGLKLAGYYDDRPPERSPQLPPGLKQRIGNIDDLVADARAGFIDRIYITFPMRAEDRIRGVLGQAGRHDRQRLYRARLLRLSDAALALDRYRRPAGGQRVRKPALRRRWPRQAAVRPRCRARCC